MKSRRKILILILLLVYTGWFTQSEPLSDVLPLPECEQELSNWCWAGASASILGYYGQFVAQCVIANYAREHSQNVDFGSTDCCKDPYQGCNEGNYAAGGAGSVQNILWRWGVDSETTAGPLSLNEALTELTLGHPFLITWAWDNGGGHFVVGHGLIEDKLHIMDPWIGEGKSIVGYDWVVSGGGHQWTSTMLMNTEIPMDLQIKLQQPNRWERVYGICPIKVDAHAPAGIDSVEFYIGHLQVGVDQSPPYTHDWNTMNHDNDKYSVSAVVVDKWGRRRTTATEVFVNNMTLNVSPMRISERAWLIKRDYAMVTLEAENVDPEIVDSCILYRKEGNGNYQQVTIFTANTLSQHTFVYQDKFLATEKSYTYRAEVFDKNGRIIASSREVSI